MKQRLVGAVVLIALAVIFVPMLLDGSGRKESAVVEAELSLDPPKFNFESELPDPKQLDSLPAAGEKSEPQAVAAPVEKSEPVEPPAPQVVKAPAPQPVEPPAPQKAKPPAEPKVLEATASKITPNPSLSGWAVQVAAFREKGKAVALQKKLMAGDFAAFTDKFEKNGKVLYRVRVGPELKRENADRLRAKIEKDQGIKGAFVTPHP